MTAVKATVNGAISIVNAIATGRGAALGISLKVDATVDVTTGTGISFNSQNHHNNMHKHHQTHQLYSRLILLKRSLHPLLLHHRLFLV